jgi:deazaflavin-dependent oxidoreductase (nitroreductase family)
VRRARTGRVFGRSRRRRAAARCLGPTFAWGGSFRVVTSEANPEQAIKDFNKTLIEEFRTNGGKVSGPFEKAPLLLLTTTGAKSGRTHTTPVVYTTDGDRIVIIASKGGAPSHPAWYHNVVANPKVTIELPGEQFDADASVAAGDERDRLFAAQAALMPNFDEYQSKTTRQIPVVVIERA